MEYNPVLSVQSSFSCHTNSSWPHRNTVGLSWFARRGYWTESWCILPKIILETLKWSWFHGGLIPPPELPSGLTNGPVLGFPMIEARTFPSHQRRVQTWESVHGEWLYVNKAEGSQSPLLSSQHSQSSTVSSFYWEPSCKTFRDRRKSQFTLVCHQPSPGILATWFEEPTHWKRPWCWDRLKAGGERDERGRDGWMASATQWTRAWANSGR